MQIEYRFPNASAVRIANNVTDARIVGARRRNGQCHRQLHGRIRALRRSGRGRPAFESDISRPAGSDRDTDS
jgi:hypothetical protein